MTDGKIVVGTEIDTSEAKKDLKKLGTHLMPEMNRLMAVISTSVQEAIRIQMALE